MRDPRWCLHATAGSWEINVAAFKHLLKTVGASSGAVLTVRTADRFPGARLFTKTVKRGSATGIGLISPEVTSSGVCVLGGEDVGGIESLPAFRRSVYLQCPVRLAGRDTWWAECDKGNSCVYWPYLFMFRCMSSRLHLSVWQEGKMRKFGRRRVKWMVLVSLV